MNSSKNTPISPLVLPPWVVLQSPPLAHPPPPVRPPLPSKHSFAVILHDWDQARMHSPYHQSASSGSVTVVTNSTVTTPEQSLGASVSTSFDRHTPSNEVENKESSRTEKPTLSEGKRSSVGKNQLVGLGPGVNKDVARNTTVEPTKRRTPGNVPGLQQEVPLIATADQADDSMVPLSIMDERRQRRQKPYEVKATRRSARLLAKKQRKS